MSLTLLFPPSLGRIKASARAELLAESLTRRLGDRVVVEVASSYGDLEERVLSGDVALAWAPPTICARAASSARAILKSVRRGRSMYRAALICRVDDELDADHLQGKRAAWVDPLSTAGYLLPLAYLRGRGHEPEDTLGEQRFVGSYRDALLAVLGREADITAVYAPTATESDARSNMSDHVGAAEVQLRPFAYSEETPADGLILSTKLSASDADRLIENLSLVTDGSKGPTLLLELFDAETLIPARPDDYTALSRALGA